MTGLKSGIFHTPFRTPFASRLIHICVDLQEIRTSDAHPQIPQEPCGRKDTEAFAHLRGQPQNPQEGRAACTKQSARITIKPRSLWLRGFSPVIGTFGRTGSVFSCLYFRSAKGPLQKIFSAHASIIPNLSVSSADASERPVVYSVTALL